MLQVRVGSKVRVRLKLLLTILKIPAYMHL